MLDKLILNVEFTGFSLAPSYTENVLCRLNFCILLVDLSDFQEEKKTDSELNCCHIPTETSYSLYLHLEMFP